MMACLDGYIGGTITLTFIIVQPEIEMQTKLRHIESCHANIFDDDVDVRSKQQQQRKTDSCMKNERLLTQLSC